LSVSDIEQNSETGTG